MHLNPYLVFKGDCAEAFRFYEKLLGGRIAMMMTHGESPMKEQVPPGWQEKILHAELEVGGKSIMGSDAPPQHYEAPQGIHVTLGLSSPAEAERIFTALAENGRVTMPFQKTFWSAGFGMVVDRFGIPWMVDCEQQPA